MKPNNYFFKIFILLACGMLAIGRLYDERLEFFEINVSLFMSIAFFLFSIPLLFSIKRIKLYNTKLFLYFFLLVILFLSPILALYCGYDTYGFQKYFNFILIVIPIVFITLERFDYNEVQFFFKVILYFIIALSLLGFVVVITSSDRLSVLGGGPIVFARWMNIGIIIIFFLQKKLSMKFILLMLFFFMLSLAAGSRGPILSLFITVLLYLVLNFKKLFFPILVIIISIGSIFIFTNFQTSVLGVGKTERLVTKDSRSKNARLVFIDRSFDLVKGYPFGVGLGNWQIYANQYDATHLLKHQYPHNLLLEIFVELGCLPGTLFLILLIKVLFFSYKRMHKYNCHKNTFYHLLFYLQFYLILNSFLSGSLVDSRFLFVIMAMVLIDNPAKLYLKNDSK